MEGILIVRVLTGESVNLTVFLEELTGVDGCECVTVAYPSPFAEEDEEIEAQRLGIFQKL